VLAHECTWIDADCQSRPLVHREGWRAQVNWIGVSPPPAPPITIATSGQVRGVEPGDVECLGGPPETSGANEVLIAWDNLVDKSINPITGAKNFKGYRIWKAANWTRESESVPTELFQLLGDFSEVADSSCVKLTALKELRPNPKIRALRDLESACRVMRRSRPTWTARRRARRRGRPPELSPARCRCS
jgi:hypothetical protein